MSFHNDLKRISNFIYRNQTNSPDIPFSFMYSIFMGNKKEEIHGYVTTGVTLIPRHLASIMCLFILDVGRIPAASRDSIQYHMVSYCSVIKCSFIIIFVGARYDMFFSVLRRFIVLVDTTI